MASYTYSGPPSGTTLNDGREVLFYDGKTYDLPAENEYVLSLVAQKRLAPTKATPNQVKAPSNQVKAPKEKEKV